MLGLTPEKTKRIVFHEITKSAILHAIETPRGIDIDRVNAQQARRVLDRIVGFELSPVLWKKSNRLSAGRVQSVAVRLIVEREKEIKNFKAEEYYRVVALLHTDNAAQPIRAELNKRLPSKEAAMEFLESCKNATFSISDLTVKPLKKSPAAPFTTSTLQQEASRKLGFTVSQTMMVAQRLYESGHITYMRTDSVNLSSLALGTIKEEIATTLGDKYYKARNYHTTAKGAQEAHEAIRPTYISHHEISGTAQEKRLYDLIWKRTIATQMADAELEKTTAEISIGGRQEKFVATGEVIKFDGFLHVYMESTDDESNDAESDTRLPELKKGETLALDEIDATQRYTQQPPRYSEAMLVKTRGTGHRTSFNLRSDNLYYTEPRLRGKRRENRNKTRHLPARAEKRQNQRNEEGRVVRQREKQAHPDRCGYGGKRFPYGIFPRHHGLQLHCQRGGEIRPYR